MSSSLIECCRCHATTRCLTTTAQIRVHYICDTCHCFLTKRKIFKTHDDAARDLQEAIDRSQGSKQEIAGYLKWENENKTEQSLAVWRAFERFKF